jgi:hypothetical protein
MLAFSLEEVMASDEITALTGLGGVFVGALRTWITLDRRISADEKLAKKNSTLTAILQNANFILMRGCSEAQTILAVKFQNSDAVSPIRA